MREVKENRQPLFRLNLLDRAIALYNPVRALARVRARAGMAVLTAESGYRGASKSRRSLGGWVTKLIGGSADADTLPDLPTLRERSRDLVRNTPIATGAVSGTTLKVVGRGLRVQSKINSGFLGLSDDEARDWQQAAEFEFNTWANSFQCDASRHNNLAGLQALVFRSTLESGDCFALLPRLDRKRGDRLPYKTSIKVIEADRVCNENRQIDKRLDNGNLLAGGIEMDPDGAALFYYIMRAHPGNRYFVAASANWDKVPAFGAQTGRRNVLHLMTRLRPGQSRGVPFLAPVIETLKQLDRYTEAEIMAAVVSGLFAVFIKHNSGDSLSPLDSAVDGKTPGSGGDQKASAWNGTLTPGLVADLEPGEEIQSADAVRPNTAFDGFVLSVMRQVGTALDIPFEVLVKHFQSSYSASRAALLEAWTFYRERRRWLAVHFCQPIYEAIIEEAVLMGRLSAPGFLEDPFVRAAYCRAIWTGDGPGSIDPLREAQAVEKRLSTNIQTLEDEVQQYDGADYEDKIKQRGRELQLQRDAGVTGSSDALPENTDINERGDTLDD